MSGGDSAGRRFPFLGLLSPTKASEAVFTSRPPPFSASVSLDLSAENLLPPRSVIMALKESPGRSRMRRSRQPDHTSWA